MYGIFMKQELEKESVQHNTNISIKETFLPKTGFLILSVDSNSPEYLKETEPE